MKLHALATPELRKSFTDESRDFPLD